MKTAFKYPCKFFEDTGFTLLEVMLSVSIIALIIVSLFRMQSGSAALATANKFNQRAPDLANQLLVKISRDLEGWSQTEGDFGDQFPGVTWTCEIADAAFEDIEFISLENMSKFKKIYLQIVDQSGGKPFELTGWRLASE